ncbi:unnamed protein product [Ranitomeya imitator]|uniref:Helix-turn-helix domain-containing protein n=1 Tax=Ranitomeya imitator TaxID=111125 RepID=A0ABN9M5B1_9NEOB|nr:unnamed protein product [Ranitomeya imitator]
MADFKIVAMVTTHLEKFSPSHTLMCHKQEVDITNKFPFYLGPGSAAILDPGLEEAGRETLDFLDVTIRRDASGVLQTDIFRKETATNTLLLASSGHPRHMIRSVPVGQFLRLRRICSSDGDFESRAEELRQRFYTRGYSHRMVKVAYHRAKYASRHNLLYDNTLRRRKDDNLRFVTTFSSRSDRLKVRIREHVLGIQAAVGHADASTLKTIPRHFKDFYNSDGTLLRVRGIESLKINIRGGGLSKRLSQLETRWIWALNTVHPNGLNECLSFIPFLGPTC